MGRGLQWVLDTIWVVGAKPHHTLPLPLLSCLSILGVILMAQVAPKWNSALPNHFLSSHLLPHSLSPIGTRVNLCFLPCIRSAYLNQYFSECGQGPTHIRITQGHEKSIFLGLSYCYNGWTVPVFLYGNSSSHVLGFITSNPPKNCASQWPPESCASLNSVHRIIPCSANMLCYLQS